MEPSLLNIGYIIHGIFHLISTVRLLILARMKIFSTACAHLGKGKQKKATVFKMSKKRSDMCAIFTRCCLIVQKGFCQLLQISFAFVPEKWLLFRRYSRNFAKKEAFSPFPIREVFSLSYFSLSCYNSPSILKTESKKRRTPCRQNCCG